MALAVEEEADPVLVAEPAGHRRTESRRALGLRIQEATALDAHEPLVAARTEVVHVVRHDVERDHAARLNRVDEELGAARVAERGHLLEGHAVPCLELDGAHGDEACPAACATAALDLVGEALQGSGHVGAVLRGGEEDDLEIEEGRRALPRGDVGGELAVEADDAIALFPGETEGHVDDAAGGVLAEGDVPGARAEEARELGLEAISLEEPCQEGGGAAALVVGIDALGGLADGDGRGGDARVVGVDARLQVGKERAIAEAGDMGSLGGQGWGHGHSKVL